MKNEWRYKGEADGEPLHYTACGLKDVYLRSGWKRKQTPYGDGITIKDIDGLHRAIALHLVCQRKALNGAELRFLRKEMDLTQDEFAGIISMTGQSVGRWEKEETEIPGPAEMLIRVLYLQHIGQKIDVKKLAAQLREIEERANQRQEFKETKDGWKVAA